MGEPNKKNRVDEIQGEIIHVYDGIEEADNELPLWWLWTFYGAIAFSVFYWFYYHEYQVGLLPTEEYQVAVASSGDGGFNEALFATYATDAAAIAEGNTLYQTNCAVCHNAGGEGNIGPNLTDAYWIHGGSDGDVYATIDEGVLQNGMPAWGQTLGSDATHKVLAFVLSLRNTNVDGKEPQGEIWTPGGDAAEGEAAEGEAAEGESAEAAEGEAAEAAEGEEAAADADEGEAVEAAAAEGEAEGTEPAEAGTEAEAPAAEDTEG